MLWNILPPTGPYGKAAVLHDWLYRTAGKATRAQADRVLREAMEALGVGWWTRHALMQTWAIPDMPADMMRQQQGQAKALRDADPFVIRQYEAGVGKAESDGDPFK